MKKVFITILVVVLSTLFITLAYAWLDKACWERCMRAGGNNQQCGMACSY